MIQPIYPPRSPSPYPPSPSPTTIVHVPPGGSSTFDTASTGADIGEPLAALGLFLALGTAAIWSAHKRKGKA